MSWLIPDWQRVVVYLGVEGSDQKQHQIGTGVLIDVLGVPSLVTCKHVVVNEVHSLKKMFALITTNEGKVVKVRIDDIKQKWDIDWIFHEDDNVDVAILPIVLDDRIKITTIPEDAFLDLTSVSDGDDLFILSFQPGLPTDTLKPIVRGGIIARLENNRLFYIDSNIFPGNSGSPVILKPSPISISERGIKISGTHLGKFIGICSAYIPYEDVAISLQTRRPRIIFEENTGLAQVWSIQAIRDIISSDKCKEYIEKLKLGLVRNETLH